MERSKTAWLAVVTGFGMVATLGACGGDGAIDSGELEEQLRVQLSEDAGVNAAEVSVACPDDIEPETGREFQCELTAPNGDLVTVDVTLTDDEGGFDAIVPPQQFED